LNTFVLLVASYFAGTYILTYFGIFLPIVQVGGGIIVIAMGWAILCSETKAPMPAIVYTFIRKTSVVRRSTL
jgi:small neutral amino acid transporter SnatA (MarC family)